MNAAHLTDDLLSAYAAGEPLPPSRKAAVETHLFGCADCRARVAPAVDPARLDAVLTEVVDRIDAPRVGAVERLLTVLGVSPPSARLLAATPSLRLSWLSGVTAALALAVVAAHSGVRGVPFFLALAPVLPVAGVALAFGRRSDPLYEVALAAPYSSYRLLLLRSVAVVTATVLLAVPVAALLPGSPWLAVAWLLPAAALTTLTLAVSHRVDPVIASAGLSTVWVAVALLGVLPGRDPLLATRPVPQLACLLLAVAGAVALATRRGAWTAPSRSLP